MEFAGVARKTLAEKCELHPTQISKFRSGEKPIPNKHRVRILETLQLTPVGWGVMEDAVMQLDRDQKRFRTRTTQETDSEYRVNVEPSEIRERSEEGTRGLDPEVADSAVSGLTRLFESGLYRVFGLFVDRQR